jgi:hypothetical protein
VSHLPAGSLREGSGHHIQAALAHALAQVQHLAAAGGDCLVQLCQSGLGADMENATRWGALLACLLLNVAEAGEATLSWTAPTQLTDGTTIPATGDSALGGYKIYYGVDGQPLNTVVDVVDETLRSYKVQNLGAGTWMFAMTAYLVDGRESGLSTTVSKVIAVAPPEPPTSLVVADGVVYAVVKRVDRFVMTPVGTVPAGTTCLVDQMINGMYVVPRSSVTWSGTVRPDVVVATCRE